MVRYTLAHGSRHEAASIIYTNFICTKFKRERAPSSLCVGSLAFLVSVFPAFLFNTDVGEAGLADRWAGLCLFLPGPSMTESSRLGLALARKICIA